MKTITEHLDDLDRMVDNGSAPKHEIRSQIAFIGKLVVALEQEHMNTVDAHLNLQEAHTKLKESEAKRNSDGWNALRKESDERQRMIRGKGLQGG